jgi:hypothetical protein
MSGQWLSLAVLAAVMLVVALMVFAGHRDNP